MSIFSKVTYCMDVDGCKSYLNSILFFPAKLAFARPGYVGLRLLRLVGKLAPHMAQHAPQDILKTSYASPSLSYHFPKIIIKPSVRSPPHSLSYNPHILLNTSYGKTYPNIMEKETSSTDFEHRIPFVMHLQPSSIITRLAMNVSLH